MNDRPEPYKIRLKEGGLLLNKQKTRTPSAYDPSNKSKISATWGKEAGALDGH
jgi:hypothetical protein